MHLLQKFRNELQKNRRKHPKRFADSAGQLKDIVHEYRMHEKNKEDIEQAVLKLQNAEYSYRRFKMDQMLLKNTEKDENEGDN